MYLFFFFPCIISVTFQNEVTITVMPQAAWVCACSVCDVAIDCVYAVMISSREKNANFE
jgi:hypothetical protein